MPTCEHQSHRLAAGLLPTLQTYPLGQQPVICLLNAIEHAFVAALSCSFPRAMLHSLSFDPSEQQSLMNVVASGRVRFTPVNDSAYGLFDQSSQPPNNVSCDILVLDADRRTAEAAEGVVLSLPQVLKLARTPLNAVVITGRACADRSDAPSYQVGGACFNIHVPAAGKSACRRSDCIVMEPCTQPASCWINRWHELSRATWLGQPKCSSYEDRDSEHNKMWCIASVNRDSICTRSEPLLGSSEAEEVTWIAPESWRRRTKKDRRMKRYISAQAQLRMQMRYLQIIPCANGADREEICLLFKDDTYESYVGALRSADGLNFRGVPEMVLPHWWSPAKATHNLAVLQWNNSYYLAGGRDRGCKRFFHRERRNDPECTPYDGRERGVWVARGTALTYRSDAGLAISADRLLANPSSDHSPWSSPRMAFSGHKTGCIDKRDPKFLPWITEGVCEYDGRLSLAHFAGRFWLYARANLAAHGQRFVQVTTSTDGLSWSKDFEPIKMLGFEPSQGEVYFFSVQANPVHPSTMVAVFPLVHRAHGCMCISISRDGTQWSSPKPLLRCGSIGERTSSHPAAGLVRRGAHVLFYVHENVPGISVDTRVPLPHKQALESAGHTQPPARILRYRMLAKELLSLTTVALKELQTAATSGEAQHRRRRWRHQRSPFNGSNGALGLSLRWNTARRARKAAGTDSHCPRQQVRPRLRVRYKAARMYGAPLLFGPPAVAATRWLRDAPPQVLTLDQPAKRVHLPFKEMKRPHSSPLNWKCPTRSFVPRGYNPSIIRAPSGLCSACVYLLSVRADAFNQCDAAGATSAGFVGTAIALLDPQLRVLTWSWLRWRSRETGRDEEMLPPWKDLRLLRVDDSKRVLASYSCPDCSPNVRVAEVRVALQRTSRAWEFSAWAHHEHPLMMGKEPWVRGSSQVVWMHQPRPSTGRLRSFGAPAPVVMVQPSLKPALIATFGPVDQKNLWRDAKLYPKLYSSHPRKLPLVCNDSVPEFEELDVHVSPTANLIAVQHQGCDIYLGVGHLHRGAADDDQAAWETAAAGYGPLPTNKTFRWGSSYTHFFYAMEHYHPFRMLATSGEFCLSSEQDGADCESIQYVSGITSWSSPTRSANMMTRTEGVVLAYGLNDCETRVAKLSLERIWQMLRPLKAAASIAGGPCSFNNSLT